jgi:hypothetical protein
VVVEFDDRTLTHQQVVIVQRFRRREAFLLSWLDDVAIGGGRCAIWMTPAVPAVFAFRDARLPPIDRAWIERLAGSADGPRGLVVADVEGRPVTASWSGHRPAVRRTAKV